MPSAYARRLAAEGGFQLFFQPTETVLPPVFTRPEFSKAGVGFVGEGAHGEFDARHMNAGYGAIVLETAHLGVSRLLGRAAEERTIPARCNG